MHFQGPYFSHLDKYKTNKNIFKMVKHVEADKNLLATVRNTSETIKAAERKFLLAGTHVINLMCWKLEFPVLTEI